MAEESKGRGIEIRIDGELVELPPRREEMIRQLVKAELELDLIEIGAAEFRLAAEKVSLRVKQSHPGVRVLSWRDWVKRVSA